MTSLDLGRKWVKLCRARDWHDDELNAQQIARELDAALAAERMANAGLRAALLAEVGTRGMMHAKRCKGDGAEGCLVCRSNKMTSAALSAAPPLPMGALRAARVEDGRCVGECQRSVSCGPCPTGYCERASVPPAAAPQEEKEKK